MAIELAEGSFDALIFDCDGTLIDTAPAHYRSLQTALRQNNRDMPADWYFNRVGLTPLALLNSFEAEFGMLPIPQSALLRIYTNAYQQHMGDLREITLVADLARQWHGRVPMAVASNGERDNVVGSLRNTNLLSLFDYIVTAQDVPHGKPAPDIYLEAARILDIAPARCTVLEDSDEGITGARAAGMTAIDIRDSWIPDWKQTP
jgi:beta-phosphoglucomutase-like phosphatase (HAD superfamily)